MLWQSVIQSKLLLKQCINMYILRYMYIYMFWEYKLLGVNNIYKTKYICRYYVSISFLLLWSWFVFMSSNEMRYNWRVVSTKICLLTINMNCVVFLLCLFYWQQTYIYKTWYFFSDRVWRVLLKSLYSYMYKCIIRRKLMEK